MIKFLKATATRTANASAAPREAIPAGHGLHPSFSKPAAATLPPDRRGRLKNGNRSGDFLAAPRCGARTRCGGACRQPAMRNGRCRMHGGLSTGPRTPEGLARSRRARLTHGGYSAHVRQLRAEARAHGRRVRALLALMRGRSAGHGVDRSSLTIARRTAAAQVDRKGAKTQRDPSGAAGRPSMIGVAPPPPQDSTSSRLCAFAVQSSAAAGPPSTAGHGVHPSFSTSRPSPRARRLLAGVAPFAGCSAGHGVEPSFFDGRPAVR